MEILNIFLLLHSFFGIAQSMVTGVCHISNAGLCCETSKYGPNCGKGYARSFEPEPEP